MRDPDVSRAKQRLDYVFDLAGKLPDEPEVLSHWARYLCVLVSGFLETSIRGIYGKYAQNKAAPNIARYVEVELDDFQNPNMPKILDLVGSFNPEWRIELEAASAGAPKEAVDSIVANRHNIAHGQTVGISLVRIRDYYQRAMKVLELIEEQCSR
ncbi:MAG: hypothetical protein HY727_18150 [Candidatus Rokubacteria bacterium]|nr:hypothetical protein [Candidatus Rokubacteria bacterium]